MAPLIKGAVEASKKGVAGGTRGLKLFRHLMEYEQRRREMETVFEAGVTHIGIGPLELSRKLGRN